jgi:5-methylcytosine-specific restriction endonuclease McrA
MIGIPKKVKRPTKKKLVDKLDSIVRSICRIRDTRCCSCGKVIDSSSQVSHYVGRRHHCLRWDLKNCHMSCAGCNIIHNYNPAPYTIFLTNKYGNEILEEFQQRMRSHTRFSTSDLDTLLKNLEHELSLIQA